MTISMAWVIKQPSLTRKRSKGSTHPALNDDSQRQFTLPSNSINTKLQWCRILFPTKCISYSHIMYFATCLHFYVTQMTQLLNANNKVWHCNCFCEMDHLHRGKNENAIMYAPRVVNNSLSTKCFMPFLLMRFAEKVLGSHLGAVITAVNALCRLPVERNVSFLSPQ